MKLEFKSLRSKIAQKMFTLFVLAAFIPLVIVAIISYQHISDQLQEETRRNVYRESKALGTVLLDRLIAGRTGLSIIQNNLEQNPGDANALSDAWIRELFSSMFIVYESGNTNLLFGAESKLGLLSTEQGQALDEGKTILQLDYRGKDMSSLFLVKQININKKQGLIVGEMNPEYVWNFSIYPPQIACVLTLSRLPIACSEIIIEEKELHSALKQKPEDRILFYFDSGSEEEYAGMTWSLFLDAEFNSEDLVSLIAIPRKTVFTIVENYKSVFPQALLLTGVFVTLLSLINIKRYMEPVEKLMEGTIRVGKGIFNQPVKVKSGDELETLSESFNDMAGQIDEHINIIKLIAEVDSLMLSTQDADYIIETLIMRLNRIMKTDHVIVVRFNDEKNDNLAILNINADDNYENILTFKMNISENEKKELGPDKNIILLGDNDERSYTAVARDKGDKYFYVFPVYIKETLAGILCFGNSSYIELSERKTGMLTEIADHTAVALSNSAWEEKLEKQIYYDSLTELPNRIYFKEILDEAIINANQDNSHIAVIVVDLDRFRIINESLGHKTGDVVLLEITKLLRTLATGKVTLIKLSNDEFAFLITGVERLYQAYSEAARLANKIIDKMKSPLNVESREIFMTASMGIAIFPQDGETMDDLLSSADSAIDKARIIGPGNYEFHDEDKDDDALHSLEISNQLRRALSNNELELYYQPKIDVKTGHIYAAEALLRWNHPVHGFMGPGGFINIAEESGLIVPIGYHTVDKACRQCKEWLDEGIDVKIAVNLSAEQFRQPDLMSHLEKVIRKTAIPAKNLELEITERTTFENHERTIQILNKLKEIGLNLSIDDFGTGYSSMSYLLQLPVDSLKVDQSFVSGIPGNKDSVSIVKAIIALAHGLNLSVVAEGVETEAQYRVLEKMKCEEIQGYYISKPLPASEFKQLVMKYNSSLAVN